MDTITTGNQTDSRRRGHLDEDTCLDLLHGLLPAAEGNACLEHLAACPACEALLRRRAAEREAVRIRRPLKTAPGRLLEMPVAPNDTDAERAQATDRRAGYLPVLRWAAGIAAAAAMLMLVFWPGSQSNVPSELLVALPAYTTDLQFRDAVDGASEQRLASGLLAYSRQEYHEAIALLQDIQVSRQLEMVRKIYLGNALAMTGRYREATTFLEPVSSHALPDPWGSEARWTLFVSWLELGETARADSLARELTEIPRDVGRRARHYLQQTE